VEALVEEARQATAQDPDGTVLPGLWRTQSEVTGAGGIAAWADLIWVIGESHAWHVVLVYTDASRAVPLARWDIMRAYRTGGPVPISETAVELDWRDVDSFVTTYIDVPPLLEALGVEDCDLTTGEALDTSGGNCGAPFFPFRTCTLLDFADLQAGGLTFGEPRATDRCAERVDVFEGWTFERASYDDALMDILDAHPLGSGE
jgi:hypothetical protein